MTVVAACTYYTAGFALNYDERHDDCRPVAIIIIYCYYYYYYHYLNISQVARY